MNRKKPFLFSIFILVLSWNIFSSYSSSAPLAVGIPGEDNCTSCHGGNNPNEFDGSIQLLGLPDEVLVPDSIYNITVIVENPNGLASEAGFAWAPLFENGLYAGKFERFDADQFSNVLNTSVIDYDSRVFHTHKVAKEFDINHKAAWTVPWKAPTAAGTDMTVNFYAAGVIADGNGVTNDLVTNQVYSLIVPGTGVSNPLQGEIIKERDAVCSTRANGGGRAKLSISGGKKPYTYHWSNNGNEDDNYYLPIGISTVTITDAVNDSIVLEVEIFDETLEASMIINDETAPNMNDGHFNITVWGGNPSYDIEWWQLFPEIQGPLDYNYFNAPNFDLSPGLYQGKIVDRNGCRATVYGHVEQFGCNLDASIIEINQGCQNQGEENVSLEIEGGTSPYQIVWSTGDTTGQSTYLEPGVYGVTITDSDGCFFVNPSYQVSDPGDIMIDFETVEGNIPGGVAGQISTSVKGNFPPFDLMWSTGDTTDILSEITAGWYSLTATDAQGCQKVDSVYLCDKVSFDLEVDYPFCPGDTVGGIFIENIEGLEPPIDYFYFWNVYQYTDGTTEEQDLLLDQAFAYQLNWWIGLSDSLGCSANFRVGFVRLDSIPPIANAVDTLFFAIDSSGIVNKVPSIWDNGSTDNCGYTRASISPNIFDCSNLGVTEIEFYAIDAAGNQDTAITYIHLIDTIAPIIQCPENIITNNCGEIHFELQDLWDNCSIDSLILMEGQESGTIFPEGMTQINYRAKDQSGNFSDCSFTIEVTNDLEANPIVEDVSCYEGNDGNVLFDFEGGTAPYDVSGITNPLPAGQYTFNVVDASGCMITDSVWVNQPDEFQIEILNIISPNCFDSNDGMISYTFIGGTNNQIDTITIQEVSAGYTNISITDDNGCLAEVEVAVESPDPIIITLNDLLPEFGGDYTALGIIDITVVGGTGPYTFEWLYENELISTSEDVDSLSAGWYEVVVTDANACTKSFEINVDFISSNYEMKGLEQIDIFPNPVRDQLFVHLDYQGDSPLYLQLLNPRGQILLQQEAQKNNALEVKDFPKGVYLLRLSNSEQAVTQKILVQ
jgi:hypothetical protein